MATNIRLKTEESQLIQSQIEAYLAGGGKITNSDTKARGTEPEFMRRKGVSKPAHASGISFGGKVLG